MSWLLFLFALFCLALAVNVVRPIYRHPKYMIYSFLFGWLAGELALHVILVQALVMLLVVWFGELEGFLDALSLGMIVSSWVVLLFHYFSAFRSAGVFAAFAGEPLPDGFSWSRLFRPFFHIKDHGLVVDKNIIYREVDGLRLKLDVRRRDRDIKNAPVLVQIHGGGWTKGYGSKNEQGLPLMQALAREGWVCVSIDYRLSPMATFPEHIIDCKHALAWVKDHIAEYGGDPNFIIVTGGSAGGHLSSLLALSDREPEFHKDLAGKDLRVQGCVPFYGIYDLMNEKGLQHSVGLEIIMRKSIIKQTKLENPDLYRLMSPINHVHADAPPFLIIHGDRDSLTSFAEAEYFSETLAEISNQTVSFAAIKGAQHAFEIFPSLRCDLVVAGVVAQVQRWHREYREKL